MHRRTEYRDQKRECVHPSPLTPDQTDTRRKNTRNILYDYRGQTFIKYV